MNSKHLQEKYIIYPTPSHAFNQEHDSSVTKFDVLEQEGIVFFTQKTGD